MKRTVFLLLVILVPNRSLISAPLQNGCAVESVAFTVEYLEKNPRENAQVLVIDDARGDGVGHAVSAYSRGDQVFIHDFELGDYLLGTRREVVSGLRERVGRRNRELVTERLRAVGRTKCGPSDDGAESLRALTRLPAATRPTRILVDDGQERTGVAFLFDASVWVYLPAIGTLRCPLEATWDYTTAITKNLHANRPSARLLAVGSPHSSRATSPSGSTRAP